MTTDEIRARLFELKDDKYAAFHRKLIPTVNPDKVLGVRTPALSFRYDDALPYIRDNKLDPDVKKKTVRKAIESYRIFKEQKDYLRNC